MGRKTTKFQCVVCGKLTSGRMPKKGDSSARFPRRHNGTNGKPCPGNIEEAKWIDV
jgi:hypothetical protein